VRYLVLTFAICGAASAALLARIGLDAGVSPGALSAWRLAAASLALVFFQIAWPKSRRLPKGDIWRTTVAGIFLAVHFATWIASLHYIPVARSTLFVSTSPLWAGLVGLAVPSLRPKAIFWVGLLVAGFGTFLVTLPEQAAASVHGPAWIGDLLATVGAICVVPYLLLSQQVQTRTGTLVTITWIYSAAAVSLLVFLAARGDLHPPSTEQAWLSILGMALFAQLIGHSLINYCLRQFTTAQVATATLLEPVFAGTLAWFFIREPVSGVEALGGAILLVGVGIGMRGDPAPVGVPEL